jgi:NADPH-dependent 2,4-dienoyl-CoA reductase/sulfur reductase-like enzyme
MWRRRLRSEKPQVPAELCDLCVVGAGPAGMAAALSASESGAKVLLVDSAQREGGQFFRQPLTGAGTLPQRFRRLREIAEVRLGADVWSASRSGGSFVVRLVDGCEVVSGALVLATGASEVVLPFPGWELPGVTTAGAAQSLLKAQGLVLGSRVVVAGTGPFLLPVAAGLAKAGARVTLVEAAPLKRTPSGLKALAAYPAKAKEAAGYATQLALSRARVLAGWAVVRCEGTGSVERAVVARLSPAWVTRTGAEKVVPADAVCVSFGFVPRVELARQLGAEEFPGPFGPAVKAGPTMGTSVPGLFVAGELAGVAGAEVAEAEGLVAGMSAASFLGFPVRNASVGGKALAKARKFARQLGPLYAVGDGWVRWLEPSTLFCRCEDVTWGSVLGSVERGARTAREVRSVTRCGMGYCQGRVCGPALQLALSVLTGRPPSEVGDLHKRPVALPVPAKSLAELVVTESAGQRSEPGPGQGAPASGGSPG